MFVELKELIIPANPTRQVLSPIELWDIQFHQPRQVLGCGVIMLGSSITNGLNSGILIIGAFPNLMINCEVIKFGIYCCKFSLASP